MIRTVTIILLSLATSAFARMPATTQSSPDAMFEELRRQAKAELNEQLKDLPDIGEKKLSELMVLHRDGEDLKLELKTDTTNEPVKLTFMPGELEGRLDVRASPDGRYVTADLQISEFHRPGEIARQTSISVNPLSVSIATFANRTLGDEAIQLFQTQDNGHYRLQLIVTEESDITAPVSLHCEATSFGELREKYGRELQKYVAPTLRSLGIEQAMFAPSLPVAQQALGIGASADPKVLQELEPLLAQLDSPDFRTRHAAGLALRKIDKQKIVSLSRADRTGWSLNRNSAIDALLAESDLPAKSDLAELTKHPIFLIDCLYLDDADVRKEALKQLSGILKLPDPIADEPQLPKRILLIDRLITQLIPQTRINPEE